MGTASIWLLEDCSSHAFATLPFQGLPSPLALRQHSFSMESPRERASKSCGPPVRCTPTPHNMCVASPATLLSTRVQRKK